MRAPGSALSQTIEMTTSEAIGYVVAWLLYALFWWFMISKFGYRGRGRFVLLVIMSIPPAHQWLAMVPTAGLLFLLIAPWPIYRELRILKEASKQAAHVPKPTIDDELNQLRKGI